MYRVYSTTHAVYSGLHDQIKAFVIGFRELLFGQDLFPVGNYASPAYLVLLRQLGLQSEDDVTAQDIYNSATHVEQLYTQVREQVSFMST